MARKRTNNGDESTEMVPGRPEEITQAQHLAVISLVAGRTITEAALDAGVNRETVSRWHNHNAAFQAALNRYRHEVLTEVDDGIRALATRSLNELDNLLEVGSHDVRLKVAMFVLSLARDTKAQIGPRTQKAVEHEQAMESILG